MTTIPERPLPANLNAERFVLGSVLTPGFCGFKFSN
jgi:hypothetical protein